METFGMRNCKKCGKVFNYIKSPICKSCEEEEEQAFEIVRLYLKENPGNDLKTVSEETGVSAKKILKFIKEGRLETTEGMSNDITCETCGKPISKGKYCEPCALKMEEKINTMFGKNSTINSTIASKPSAKMYTQRNKER